MKGLEPEELQKLILTVGRHKKIRHASPYEIGQILYKAKRSGNSLKECAEACNIRDVGTIANFIRLLDIVPSYRHLVDWGKTGSTIAFKTAATLAKLSAYDQEIAFVSTLEKQIKKVEVEQIVQLRQRSGRDIEECIDEIVGMRPIITTVHVLMGVVDAGPKSEKLSDLSQNEKDNLLKTVLLANYPNLQKFSARLGDNRFTITLDSDDADYLGSKLEEVEDIINRNISDLI